METKKKILVVDDIEINRKILKNMLDREYDVIEADDGDTAIKVLKDKSGEISAVLLDLVMPRMGGYEVLKIMRSDPEMAIIPVLMTTVEDRSTKMIQAFECGANDFISKPYESEVIRNRLRNFISFRETAAFANDAKYDNLTKLANRRTFLEKADQLIKSHPANYYVMSMFNISRFRIINEQLGNEVGDRVLIDIGRGFKDISMKMEGICARVMGDYFALLYPAKFIGNEEYQKMLSDIIISTGIFKLSYTVGRFIIDDTSLSSSECLECASSALLSIKGRTDIHVAYFTNVMKERINKEKDIVSRMENALVNNEFTIYIQPQYNHATKQLYGGEALVRWNQPDKGMISPGDFIPVFESNGFIYRLDKYVWEKTAQTIRMFMDKGHSVCPISVNVSRTDALQKDCAEFLEQLVEKYRLPKHLLRLEITESAFVLGEREFIESINKLRNKGFVIEIDDFGSGYSSLNILKDIYVDIIKLDMKFFAGEANRARAGFIINSVARMAHCLNTDVIAEGVESKEYADFLITIGCPIIQGYLYSRPVPIEEFEKILTEKKYLGLSSTNRFVSASGVNIWDANSLDALIFSSYIGPACIFEYYQGQINVFRVNERYVETVKKSGTPTQNVMMINPMDFMKTKHKEDVHLILERIIKQKGTESFNTFVYGLYGTGSKVLMHTTIKYLAENKNRYLLFASFLAIDNEDIEKAKLR